MNFPVEIVAEAEDDILEIHNYVTANDSPESADSILFGLEEAILSLGKFPERGHVPPELRSVGILDYREIHFGPYRIIYQIIEKRVFVHCTLDGRRDLQELLEHRILR